MMEKIQFSVIYWFFILISIYVKVVQLQQTKHYNTYSTEEFTEVEYQLIIEDSNPAVESSIRRPMLELELTPEEEIELKTGICKVVLNDANVVLSHAVYKRNEIALEKMERNLYLFILSESLRDYANGLKTKIEETKVEVTPDELDTIDSATRVHCDMADLQEIYNTLINIPDTYEDLSDGSTSENGTTWENFVAMQLDRVYDYVDTHFNMFKQELLRLKNTKAYYERKNFFRKRFGKAILMTIFYDWLENMVCRPKRIDEYKIREKLNEHLKWVVSLPIE